jgi:hypothetical protein
MNDGIAIALVIAGLDPAIHQSSNHPSDKMDARVKPAHDKEEWPSTRAKK